jgi:hypothetical protein
MKSDINDNIINCNTIQYKFEELIKQFIEYRKKHGGIMLPDEVIIDNAFNEAMYETGIRKRPPEYKENDAGIFILMG